MKIYKYPGRNEWPEILKRPAYDARLLDKKVGKILKAVQKNGDRAVKKFTAEFDGVRLRKLEVTGKEFREAEKELGNPLQNAIRMAMENIQKFHQSQAKTEEVIETMPGVKCWRKSLAIEKVGIYIPGGTAPLFSTILMLAVPAVMAGCREIIMCSPPGKDGKLHPAILFTAKLAGVTRIFKVGGVQAIGAMAYGTATIPAVYKIFGPGNQYVTSAKKLIQQDAVSIDMPAGPSEVAIYADETAIPAFVAADLLSQAEHGADSQVILVSSKEGVLEAVSRELKRQSAMLNRKELVEKALAHSRMLLVQSEKDAIDILNDYAAEHLILNCKNAAALAEGIRNAGSVFLGNYSPESAGDYASGTNHTLPTNGYAKAYSGVSLDSFVKKVTFQQLSPSGLEQLADAVILMAEAEGLQAHARAISIRIDKTQKEN
ncbi:MAG: histidinol dehydrogenase [Terrimonas sp.]|nr:histidinol dehydrogenase [Terrimonas sp.]